MFFLWKPVYPEINQKYIANNRIENPEADNDKGSTVFDNLFFGKQLVEKNQIVNNENKNEGIVLKRPDNIESGQGYQSTCTATSRAVHMKMTEHSAITFSSKKKN